MRQRTIRRGARLSVRGLLVAAAIVVLTATQADAFSPGTYSISHSSGATFALLSSNNLVSGAADDVLYYLSTTSTGIHKLPFALHLYNQTYPNIGIDTNGNVRPGLPAGSGSSVYNNDCLTTMQVGRPLVAVFWDDLAFDSNDTSHGFTEGVFVRTTGTAPHRNFTVSWQGHLFTINNTNPLVLAQVIFHEGSQTVNYVYGLNGGSGATIGIQSKQQLSSTQFECNGVPTTVTSGEKLTLTHSG
jgi:hypothetical protein